MFRRHIRPITACCPGLQSDLATGCITHCDQRVVPLCSASTQCSRLEEIRVAAMELSQLRAFVEIAKIGQLTRAAEKLHLSQPALSGQLKSLEESLGVSLFDRSSSGMALTAAGRALLAEAERIVDSVEQLQLAARQLQGRASGRLRVGTVLDPETLRVGEFLARAVEAYPLIEIELHQLFSGAALEGVRD